jgi:hypothetical protein
MNRYDLVLFLHLLALLAAIGASTVVHVALLKIRDACNGGEALQWLGGSGGGVDAHTARRRRRSRSCSASIARAADAAYTFRAHLRRTGGAVEE